MRLALAQIVEAHPEQTGQKPDERSLLAVALRAGVGGYVLLRDICELAVRSQGPAQRRRETILVRPLGLRLAVNNARKHPRGTTKPLELDNLLLHPVRLR